jgi:hypothetical protein
MALSRTDPQTPSRGRHSVLCTGGEEKSSDMQQYKVVRPAQTSVHQLILMSTARYVQFFWMNNNLTQLQVKQLLAQIVVNSMPNLFYLNVKFIVDACSLNSVMYKSSVTR